ncbi:MAG: phosphotransferase [Alteromonadaceae bacterium]|nr:phosphotransferase [Alteromonadaceae bacterium]
MSSYFSAAQIHYLEQSLNSQSLVFEPISANASNHAMKLVTSNAEYLVKTFTTDALYTADRQDIFDLQTQLHEAGLASEPVLFDSELNLWVEKWITAQPKFMSRLLEVEMLASISADIHQCTPSRADRVNLPKNWRRYSEIIQRTTHSKDVMETFEHLLDSDTDKCFCHNDLSLSHIIHAEPSIAVDWEYAGLGHRAFDLASTMKINNMNAREQEQFLQIYAARLTLDISQLSKKVSDMIPIVDFTYNLWHNAFNELN